MATCDNDENEKQRIFVEHAEGFLFKLMVCDPFPEGLFVTSMAAGRGHYRKYDLEAEPTGNETKKGAEKVEITNEKTSKGVGVEESRGSSSLFACAYWIVLIIKIFAIDPALMLLALADTAWMPALAASAIIHVILLIKVV